MRYEVEIIETLSRVITVDADSQKKALEDIELDYKNEDIVLDESDFVGVDFLVAKKYKKRKKLKG